MHPSTTSGPSTRAVAGRVLPAVLLGVLLVLPAFGQDGAAPLRITQYVHTVWTSEEGLPQNSVFDIHQTSDGFLWIATQGGLARFDGVRFHTLTQEDGLPSADVSVLLEASDGSLWIGTTGGGVGHLKEGEIETLSRRDGLHSDLIRSLYEDRDGILWIGTIDGGLHRYDGARIRQIGSADGLAGDVVLAIHQTDDGDLWVGTEAGLSRIRGRQITNYSTDDGLAGALIWAIHEDPSGSLWIGASGGMSRLAGGQFETFRSADGLCGDVVDAFATDAHGALWIGTLGGGVCRLADGRFDTFTSADGLTNDRVRAIEVDDEKNVWIGTERGGLDQLRIGKFGHVNTAEGLSHDVALSVHELPSGALAVGTEGGGLSLIDGGSISHVTTGDGLPSDDVYALEIDRRGRIWVGMYGAGICRLSDTLRPERCFTQADGLPSNSIYSMYADSRDRLWVGTLGGLALIDGERVVENDVTASLREVPVWALREDTRGDMWIGTYGRGVYRVLGDGVLNYSMDTGLTSDIILTLYEDAEGAIWAGTQGGGLCRMSGGGLGCASTPDGLPSDVLQLVEDDFGRFWLGSLRGVHQVKRGDVEALLDGHAERVVPTHFDRSDGLRVEEMNGGTQPSAWKSRDGRLWFTTNDGVAVIDPAEMRTNVVPPPVHVECVHVNDEHMPVGASIELAPGSRDVTFYYTAMSFTAAEKVRFQYRLEGYDDAWIDAGSRREAYYTNLPPGTYSFVVRAANNDGVWNETGDEVAVHLKPYLYQTWWFMVLSVFGLAAAGLLAYRFRIRNLRAHERELARLVDARTRDLRREKERLEEAKHVIEGQAAELRDLNDHLEAKVGEQFDLLVQERERYEADLIRAKERAEASDRLKTAILNNLNHEFRTPLTAILGFSEIIATEAADEMQSFTSEIRNGGKRLLRTLDALLEFSRLESEQTGSRVEQVDLALCAAAVVRDFQEVTERKQLALSFEAPGPVPARVDASAVEEVIWKLVDNAVKFTPDGEVVVSVGTDAGRAFVRIRDTGVGIGDEFIGQMYEAFTQESDGFNRTFEGVGLGLTITKRLVDQMGGEIEVHTNKGRGSVFTVWFETAEVAV